MKDLGIHKDKLNNSNYTLCIINSAKELSKELKKTYKTLKIDFKQFNSESDYEGVADNPPIEIYEYQNFFLLEKSDGNIVLLDGFRRLLWYNAPDTPITTRIYKQNNLSDKEILTLLVNLNHFKFYSSSSYQDKGFSLLLKTVFDVNICKFRNAFDSYLSSYKTTNGYYYHSSNGNDKNQLIKDRIVNDRFVDDLKFMSKLNDNGCMVNKFFGALVYKKRTETDKIFSSDEFLKLEKKDKVISELMKKFNKFGTNNSSKSIDVVNQIQEIYNNYFTIMLGGKVEKSYAEKVQECKDIRKELNKDKKWTKLTGNRNTYEVERMMKIMLSKTKDKNCLKFKMIVFPKNKEIKRIIPLEYGYNELPKFIELVDSNHYGHNKEMVIGFTDESTGASWKIQHNYGGYNSYGKKYTKADFVYEEKISDKYNQFYQTSYNIELWVNVKK